MTGTAVVLAIFRVVNVRRINNIVAENDIVLRKSKNSGKFWIERPTHLWSLTVWP